MKQSEQLKLWKTQRNALIALRNRVEVQFSVKQIKTWGDVFKYVSAPEGTTPEKLSSPVIFQEIKVYFNQLLETLERKQRESVNIKEADSPRREEPNPLETDIPERQTDKTDRTTSEQLPPQKEEPALELDTSLVPSVDNDYLLPPSNRESKEMIKYWFQRKAAKELWDNITIHKHQGNQVIAAAGYGKTFIAGALAVRLIEHKFAENKSYGPISYLYVTKNSVVEQTKRVFKKMFNISIKDGFEVINYESLRAKAGALWVREQVKIEGGEEKIFWEWRKFMNPVVIFWDENQSLKNASSLQHQIACQFNEITTPTVQVFISATPYTRVSEAKCFAVSTKKDITNVMGTNTSMSNMTWPTYASVMAGSQSAPEDYNEAAVERLTKDLEPYIVRVRGVRPQFHAINRIEMIDFETKEEKKYYDETEERYAREKAKLDAEIDSGSVTGGGMHHFALLTKRAVAAEFCRRYQFVKRMVKWSNEGFAAACAVKYKTTLIPMVKILIEDYNIPRDRISLIWGGGQTQLTKKQKAKAQINAKIERVSAALGMNREDILKNLNLEDVEDRVLEELPDEYKLGAQSPEERQREIDKFQRGQSLFCIYTFKAGGVGLSLHHTDEQTTQKVHRQKSGYAVVEDIPNIPTRPRKTALSVAYSGIDMVQSIGRVPRLTSLSDTEQVCFMYNHTVEVDIAHVYSSKLRCLNKVVRNNESWLDIIMSANRAELVAELMKNDTDESGSDDGLITETEESDED